MNGLVRLLARIVHGWGCPRGTGHFGSPPARRRLASTRSAAALHAWGLAASSGCTPVDIVASVATVGEASSEAGWPGGETTLLGTSGGAVASTGGGAGSSATGGWGSGASTGTADDGCDVGLLDPANPPEILALSGDLGAHDPMALRVGDVFWLFTDGDGVGVKTSPDLHTWVDQPPVFATLPGWFSERVPDFEPSNLWAPEVSFFGGVYHLYYSVSAYESDRSCIGHATRASLESGEWEDRGPVLCSNQPGETHDWNAVDGHVVLDEDGTPWMAFGAFKNVTKMMELTLEGERASEDFVDLVRRDTGVVNAPFIVRRCGYYYLFVSFDDCCLGLESTYNIRVGRSVSVQGPYVSPDGTPMLEGGGGLLVEGNADWIGPGHNAILVDGAVVYNLFHAYSAAEEGAARLRIAEIAWDTAGWPISAGP